MLRREEHRNLWVAWTGNRYPHLLTPSYGGNGAARNVGGQQPVSMPRSPHTMKLPTCEHYHVSVNTTLANNQ